MMSLYRCLNPRLLKTSIANPIVGGWPNGRQNGFTLVEWLTWMTLVVVLSVPVVPAVQDAMARWRSQQAQSDLQRAVRLTQSLAMQQHRTLTLGPHTDCVHPEKGSVPPSQAWSCGWMVFEDINVNRKADDHEPRWLEHDALWPLQLNSSITRPVRFDSEGLTTDWITWTDCDVHEPTGLSRWKATLSRLGRLNLQTGSAWGCQT